MALTLSVLVSGAASAQLLSEWHFGSDNDLPVNSWPQGANLLELETSVEYLDGKGIRLTCEVQCGIGFRSDSLTSVDISAVRISVRSRHLGSSGTPMVANTGVDIRNGPNVWNPVEIAVQDDWQVTTSTIPVSGTVSQAWISFVSKGATDFQVDSITIESVTLGMTEDDEFANGSKIDTSSLELRSFADYALATKVWGLLKYYDARAYSGERLWDFEFIRLIHRLLESPNEKASEIIYRWQDSFGSPEYCAKCSTNSKAILVENDLSWIENDMLLGSDLSAVLRAIVDGYDSSKENYWVSQQPWTGQPVFSNEMPFDQFEVLDAGFRLLALARVWNLAEYWFPYKHLIDRNWEDVLGEYIPKFIAADSQLQFESALVELLAEFDDSHVVPLTTETRMRNWFGNYRLPFQLVFIENKLLISDVVDSSMAEKERQDFLNAELVEIDGESIPEIAHSIRILVSKSNERRYLRELAGIIVNRKNQTSRVTIVAGDDTLSRTLSLSDQWPGTHVADRDGEAFQNLTDEIGYLKISAADSDSIGTYLEGISQVSSLVIDARGYPNGILWSLAPHLISENLDFAHYSVPDFSRPGNFVRMEQTVMQPLEPNVNLPKVILANEYSQSAAEGHIMGFQATDRSIVVGSQTAGANGNVSRFAIPGGYYSRFSGIGVYYPNGRIMQRSGVLIDVWSEPTLEGFRSGRDEVLEDGLRVLLGASVSEDQIREIAKKR